VSLHATCYICERTITADVHFDDRGFCHCPGCLPGEPSYIWGQLDLSRIDALLSGSAATTEPKML
jgi:hypothetical protein